MPDIVPKIQGLKTHLASPCSNLDMRRGS